MRAKNPAIIAKGVRLIIANCFPSRSPEKKKYSNFILKFYGLILGVKIIVFSNITTKLK